VKLRRHMTSIVFIVAAVAVSVYAYVVDRGKVTDVERQARGAALFPAFRHEEVSRIELTHGEETLVLSRKLDADGGEADWRMEFPVPATVDPAAVQNLLDALDHGNALRRVDGDDKVANPRVRGTVTMGKVTYRFTLGGEAPKPEGAGYLKLEGEGTFVVSRDLTAQLLKGAEAYRERTIVPYLSIALSRLRVGSWTIERTDDISFRFADEPKVRVSREAIDRVWRALGETRADSFLDAEAARRALGEPQVIVVMTPKEPGQPQGELAVGGVCPNHPDDVVVARKTPTPLAACAPKVILEGLTTPRDKLADTRLFAARFDEVEELRLETLPSGAMMEIARKGSGWHARAPEDRELAKDEVEMANGLVTAIAKGEGRPLSVEEASKIAFTPRARATVLRAETGTKEVLELGGAGATGPFWVRRAADGVTLAVDRELSRKLEPHAIVLRGRELWTSPLEGKEVASVGTRCAGVDQELVREDKTFLMRKPAGYPADNGAAIDVFEALARAKVESWVADADDGSFGFADACRISVAVKTDGGVRNEALLLGREGEGGIYAKVDGKPAVFVVQKNLKELAARPLVDRNAFFLDPASVSSVVLRRGATSKTFAHGEGEVAVSLGRLRAEEVTHLGAAKADEGFGAPSLEIQATAQNDAGAKTLRITLGHATLLRDQKVYFARIAGIDATFVIAKERVQPLLDAVELR
jgi:hypothetical protein